MGKRALGIVLAVAFALSALGAPALAGDNGQKIGQDDIRLLLTQCSNAGAGNGSEYEAVIGEILITKYFTQSKFVVVASDCLGKKLTQTVQQLRSEIFFITRQRGKSFCAQIL